MLTNSTEAKKSEALAPVISGRSSPTVGAIAKRVVKLAVSLLYYSGTRIWRGLRRLSGGEPAGTCVVLYYHAVPAELRARFAKQMDVLKRCAKPVRADRQEALENGVHHAVVTFHDAFVSVAENALPELAQRGIPSTVFVPTGYLGQRPGWIKDEAHSDFGEMVMDADRLRSLNRELVSIGSHTVHHPSMPTLSEADAREEFQKSKSDLESLLGRPVELFAFPYGDYNANLVEWSSQAGYQRAFTIEPKLAYSEPKECLTGSCSVSPKDWELEFRMKLLGAYCWLIPVKAFRKKVNPRLRNVVFHAERTHQENI